MSECRGHCDKFRVLSRVGLGVQTKLISTSTSFIARISLKNTQNLEREVSYFWLYLIIVYHCS